MRLDSQNAAILNSVLTALQVVQASQDELATWLKIIIAAVVGGLQAYLTQMAFKRMPDGEKLPKENKVELE
jgi:heme/copper-type cytochrome/quinol oxidase subunit 4